MRPSDFHRMLTGPELAALYRVHMRRDFPPNELKSLSMLENLTQSGINSVWAFERDGALAGYYVLARVPGSSMVLLDYLAVVPELRNTGVGSALMAQIVRRLPPDCYLLIESERPEPAPSPEEQSIRARRVGFYQRCGAVRSPLNVRLFGVDYAVLTLPAERTPSPPQQRRDYLEVYRSMLPPAWCGEHLETFLP